MITQLFHDWGLIALVSLAVLALYLFIAGLIGRFLGLSAIGRRVKTRGYAPIEWPEPVDLLPSPIERQKWQALTECGTSRAKSVVPFDSKAGRHVR